MGRPHLPGSWYLRGMGYFWLSGCVSSELLHQSNMPIDEEKLNLGPFCICFISVNFFENGIGN